MAKIKKKAITLADIPMPTFLQATRPLVKKTRNRRKDKYADAYDAYARWSAMPKELREPKEKNAFRKLWKLPPNYVYKWEDQEEFQSLKYKYFWRWMFDQLPDIAYASLQRAMAKMRGSAQDAKLLMDLIGKKIEADRPTTTRIQPFFLIGVNQNKIEELFTPPEYVKTAEDTIKLERQVHSSVDYANMPNELRAESM